VVRFCWIRPRFLFVAFCVLARNVFAFWDWFRLFLFLQTAQIGLVHSFLKNMLFGFLAVAAPAASHNSTGETRIQPRSIERPL